MHKVCQALVVFWLLYYCNDVPITLEIIDVCLQIHRYAKYFIYLLYPRGFMTASVCISLVRVDAYISDEKDLRWVIECEYTISVPLISAIECYTFIHILINQRIFGLMLELFDVGPRWNCAFN